MLNAYMLLATLFGSVVQVRSILAHFFIYFSYSLGPEELQRGVVVANEFVAMFLEVCGVRNGSNGGREVVPIVRSSWNEGVKVYVCST